MQKYNGANYGSFPFSCHKMYVIMYKGKKREMTEKMHILAKKG